MTKLALAALALACATAHAQGGSDPVLVTVDNFIRAETDTYFATFARRGAFGRFDHSRDLPLGDTGVRPNRDTLYSMAVFDLDAGPVTITLPDAGRRFMTMMVVDQDHYVHMVVYGKGAHTLERKAIGTRYVFAAVRTLVDPTDPEDFDQDFAEAGGELIFPPGEGLAFTTHDETWALYWSAWQYA